MRKADEQKGRYMEVWGDTVVPGQLAASALICVVTTMAFFLVGRTVLLGVDSLEPALAKGYALFGRYFGHVFGRSDLCQEISTQAENHGRLSGGEYRGYSGSCWYDIGRRERSAQHSVS